MKIVFLAPAAKDKNLYTDLIKELKTRKNIELYDATFPFTDDEDTLQSFAADLTREIKKTDALIVEATKTTFDMGRFITLAIQQYKPVLMLQREKKTSPILLAKSRIVWVKPYSLSQKKEFEAILKKFFQNVKNSRLSYRFNLMLSDDMNMFVMDKAQTKSMSKADYIRNLIIDDMDE